VEVLLRAQLKDITSVAMTCDGWSDRKRRNWLSFSINFIDKEWNLVTISPDLLLVSDRSTSENIANLLNGAIERWIPSNCLKATQTTDGAANEQGAAELSVGSGNHLHCCCHALELCISDCLDEKPSAYASTQPHRALLKKFHDLVVLIRAKSELSRYFSELVSGKQHDRKFNDLVMNNGMQVFPLNLFFTF
jgi:hypothetical protein